MESKRLVWSRIIHSESAAAPLSVLFLKSYSHCTCTVIITHRFHAVINSSDAELVDSGTRHPHKTHTHAHAINPVIAGSASKKRDEEMSSCSM